MKTGTTFIQAVLWRNRRDIGERAMVHNSWDRDWDLRDAANAFCAKPSLDSEKKLKDAAHRVIQRAIDCSRPFNLLTEENILGYRLYDEAGDVFSKAERLLPLLTEVCDGFAPEFVFYTRDMPEWFLSCYNQDVKQTRQTATFDDWRAGLPFEADWTHQFERLQNATSATVRFHDMTTDVDEGGIMGRHLFERIGVSEELQTRLFLPEGRNESLPPGALEFMRQINATRMPDRQLTHVRRVVVANPQLFASEDQT